MERRAFLGTSLLALAGCHARRRAPAVLVPEAERPLLTDGVMSGDLTGTLAVLWARTDRRARLRARVGPRERLEGQPWQQGPVADESSDFTARMLIDGLPPGGTVHYEVQFQSLSNPRATSRSAFGRLRAPPSRRAPGPLRVVWSGDSCGQGWGIDLGRGGLRIYETIRSLEPDLFVHCGDRIYADDALRAPTVAQDGLLWTNLLTDAKLHHAQTLDDFRGNYRYNLLDPNLQALHAQCPLVALWDDHEVVNNWWPGLVLEDPRYDQEPYTRALASHARRAMAEYSPMLPTPELRVYRALHLGPSLDLFALDTRSYRGPNGRNDERERSVATAWLGEEQRRWLVSELAASRAQWKVIACDMPLGLVSNVGSRTFPVFETSSNGDNAQPLGRELEIAALLSELKAARVRNVVWVTADVHYAAAHHFAPERAAFRDFDPFWEFVAGPLHAHTFGPNALDGTFGPEVRFQRAPPRGRSFMDPTEGYQFFGMLDLDPQRGTLTASLWDVAGTRLYSVELEALPC